MVRLIETELHQSNLADHEVAAEIARFFPPQPIIPSFTASSPIALALNLTIKPCKGSILPRIRSILELWTIFGALSFHLKQEYRQLNHRQTPTFTGEKV